MIFADRSAETTGMNDRSNVLTTQRCSETAMTIANPNELPDRFSLPN
jgi:hypothetical protein